MWKIIFGIYNGFLLMELSLNSNNAVVIPWLKATVGNTFSFLVVFGIWVFLFLMIVRKYYSGLKYPANW